MSFFASVLELLHAFAKSYGADPADVHVQVTLADGDFIILQQLATHPPASPEDWGLISGKLTGGEPLAVVVRDTHVFKAEFRLAPAERSGIGFHAETE